MKQDPNDNWLASSDDKTETGKKSKKRSVVWTLVKELIRIGYYICKIIEFFDED